MTIKRRWITHVPIFGDVKRSKVVPAGYAEVVDCRTIDDEGRGYHTDKAVVKVDSDRILAIEILLPGTIKDDTSVTSLTEIPNAPGIVKMGDTGVLRRNAYEGEEINTHFPDIYAGHRDETFMVKPNRGILDKPQVYFTYEPTLPSQSRK